MIVVPCVMCENVKKIKIKKTHRTLGWFNKCFTPTDWRHTCTRSRTDVTPTLATFWHKVRRDSVPCQMTRKTAGVPCMRKSCSLHHKDHMLAVSHCEELQAPAWQGTQSARGERDIQRLKRREYREEESVCMWISVFFMCQHEYVGINGYMCTIPRSTLFALCF